MNPFLFHLNDSGKLLPTYFDSKVLDPYALSWDANIAELFILN
jgi:hypothetical protein